MKKRTIILWMPVVLGIVLILLCAIQVFTLQDSSENLTYYRQMIACEMNILVLGFLWSVGVLFSCVFWLIKKQSDLALQAIIVPILWFVCFGFAAAIGGGFIWIT